MTTAVPPVAPPTSAPPLGALAGEAATTAAPVTSDGRTFADVLALAATLDVAPASRMSPAATSRPARPLTIGEFLDARAAALGAPPGSALSGLGAGRADLLAGVDEAIAPRLTAAGPVPAVPAPAGTTPAVEAFLADALAQAGDAYVWGAEAAASDLDPRAFDCSELVQWAAARQGVELTDGSWLQFLDLQAAGATIPVDVALRTPGALLFRFSSEPAPGGPRPAEAHVAISLGDGRTIEARGSEYGVGIFDATDRGFQYGAVIPGLHR